MAQLGLNSHGKSSKTTYLSLHDILVIKIEGVIKENKIDISCLGHAKLNADIF